MSKKDTNPSKKLNHSSSQMNHSVDHQDSTMLADDVLSEDSEFPAFVSKKNGSPSLYRDAERKKSEMKNSTIGGF